ncbi:hypothetical protein CT19431_MP100060 [Cupriavidus taiwanensis]|nr:hypothetical protein CT19431_MP100060 [Cupriavidus taiwanensis]
MPKSMSMKGSGRPAAMAPAR